MKVLHILQELKFSGAEIMYVDAAPEFQKLGCELSVVNSSEVLGEYAVFFENAGYEVKHIVYPGRRNIFKRMAYIIQMVSLLKREHFDVVHVHSSLLWWDLSLISKMAGTTCLYTFHNVFPSNWYSYGLHRLKRYTAKKWFGCRFQTISDSVYNHELNYYKNSTTKIYNWYGSNRYFPAIDDEKLRYRKELNIEDHSLVVISVGGCSDIKRHHDIIKALPLILKVKPDTIYLHLGRGITEREENELVEKLNLQSNVRFCGNQSDVRKFLIASDIYLIPSRFEGISITTIEALACKIPAILYAVPGLVDFNATGENCMIIEENYNSLANSISALFTNKALMEKLSDNAKQFVAKQFDMSNNVQQIYKLYLQ